MKKAYFQYYETFEDILAKIKDDVKREAFRRVIIRYGLYGTVPTGLTEIEDMAWGIIKDLIDQQQHRREEGESAFYFVSHHCFSFFA